jgi:hypothetical protein
MDDGERQKPLWIDGAAGGLLPLLARSQGRARPRLAQGLYVNLVRSARVLRQSLAGSQLISTFVICPGTGLVGIRDEVRIIGESLPHPFRQPGFKVHPLSSEPLVCAPMHPWRSPWKRP